MTRFKLWVRVGCAASIFAMGCALGGPAADSQTVPILEVANAATPTVWSSGPPEEPITDVRFRVTADEGGWVILALDGYCTHPGAPSWLLPGPPIALTSLGPVNAPGVFTVLSEPVARHLLTIGFTDFWTENIDYNAVRSWYVPLLSGAGTRLWSASPTMWSQSNSTYGEVSQSFWNGMTTVSASGLPGTGVDFNVLSMFRWALKLRSLTDPTLPANAVDEFLQSPAFHTALTNEPLDDLGIHLQVFFLRDPANPPAAASAAAAPTLAMGPLSLASLNLTLPVKRSVPDAGALNPNAILGTFSPGQEVTFSLGNTVPPVSLLFNTTGGTVPVLARSDVRLRAPNQYRVTIPPGVLEGAIVATDPLHPVPQQIGEVIAVN